MNPLQWFKNRTGKKVVASHETDGKGTIHIKNEDHAERLYKSHAVQGYSFRDYNDDEEDNTLSILTTGILIGELLSDSGGSQDTSSSDTSSNPSFEGFGSGDFGGGGASGGWTDSSSSDSSSSSDYSSSDSSSSDSSSSSDF